MDKSQWMGGLRQLRTSIALWKRALKTKIAAGGIFFFFFFFFDLTKTHI